ncbi:hypothetical protein AZE42_05488 [Rhizopogon vesiculosus]|uniref:Berberine/berberine-like domain-containing protein n=1 Tax=Rhizopogon vesiculosus TaxID=180088 RepID=A0A1J8Q360_9AGAM|nr:hypothetical protein AZE42_05488 [Rhizopogon vesiculosus]
MSRLTTLLTGLSLALLSASTEVRRAGINYAATCHEIATSVSSASKVYYPGFYQYTKDNAHWTASSSQLSACSFEPATAADVAVALQILAKDQTPFAYYAEAISKLSGKYVLYEGIPFLESVYTHAETQTAFPSLRDSSQGSSFINVFFGWTNPNDDNTMIQLGEQSVAYMKQFVASQGQDVGDALLNPNNAPPNTPMANMYGDALERLQSIKLAVDPTHVMNLAGGWKF